MQNFKSAGFIKSYPALLKLPITVSEKSLIELVLSFTDKGNDFYMNYIDIAPYLNFSKVQSVKNVIFNLRKKGYITTMQSHNYNGSAGGSSTSIVINEDLINLQLKAIINEENKGVSSDLNNDTDNNNLVVASSEIITKNEDNSIEYDFNKMIVLCEKSEIINSLVADFIPKDENYLRNNDFYIGLENHMKSIFKILVLERNDLREIYQSIELDEVETETES